MTPIMTNIVIHYVKRNSKMVMSLDISHLAVINSMRNALNYGYIEEKINFALTAEVT